MKRMSTIFRTLPENIKDSDKYIFMEALHHKFAEPSFDIKHDCLWNPVNNGRIISGAKGIIKSLFLFVIGYRKIKTLSKAVFVTDNFSNNYFHWINDVLPKLILLESNGVKATVLLSEGLIENHYVRESLIKMNWTFYVAEQGNYIYIKDLIIPDLTAGIGNQHPVYFSKLADRLRILQKEKKQRKVFISRKNSITRNVKPLSCFEKLLTNKGIEVIETEGISFIDQIKLFSECSHVIGVHGAGLTNMTFMPPKSKVLEIRRDDDQHNYCYYAMANSLNHYYYYYLASSACVSKIIQEDDMVIDLNEFESVLDIFLLSK